MTSSASTPTSTGGSWRVSPVASTATRTGRRSGSTTTSTRCPGPREEATHEAWSLMAAFAGVTGRVRLGQMCTCMGYRNPAHLAKVAATVDVISEGRLDMGIGAGWYEHEWRAYGYGFPSAGERIAALGEGVEILRQTVDHRPRHVCRGALHGRRSPVLPPPAPGRERPGEPRATASPCGSPVAGNGRRCGSPRSTPTTRTSRRDRGVQRQERGPAPSLRRRRPGLRRDRAQRRLQRRHRSRRGRGARPDRLDPRPLHQGRAAPGRSSTGR